MSNTNLTPERVRWFADYLKANPGWGIFHVSLDYGTLGPASDHIWDAAPYTEAELREQAEWFNRLSPRQRERLKLRAEDLANSIVVSLVGTHVESPVDLTGYKIRNR